jgi:hypothetical protein
MTDASKRIVRVAAEDPAGTVPTNANWMAVSHSRCNLKAAIQRIESALIRTTRDVQDSIDVSRSGSGTLDAELQHATTSQGLWRLWLSMLQTTATSAQTAGVSDASVLDGTISATGIGTGVEVGDIVRVRTSANALVGYYRVTGVSANDLTVEGTIGNHAPFDYKVVRGTRIKNGATAYPSSIEVSEDSTGDGVVDRFEIFTNMNVDTGRLRVADGAVTEISFGFVGANSDGGFVTSQKPGTPVEVAAPDTEVMNSKGHVKAIRVAGTEFEAKSVEWNVANAMAPRTVIGTLPATGIRSGTFRATGTISAYFSTFTEYSKAIAGTASSLMLAWEDAAGNAFCVALPRIKYTDQERPSTGQDTDIFVNLTFATLNAGGDDDASMRIYSFTN